MPLKLVSLNIERSKHLDTILPFFAKVQPDVVCLQEVMEYDLPRLCEALGTTYAYAPMTLHQAEGRMGPMGIALFSRAPTRTRIRYYRGSADALPTHVEMHEGIGEDEKSRSVHGALLVADVDLGDAQCRIATTHFTWTAKGAASAQQREDMRVLLDFLADEKEFVLCGDFNAPRGGEIFSMLAAKYTDNVPAQYATSIDAALHRAGKTRPEELADKMVDGLFSTDSYQVENVEMASGVSDHYALIADISRA